MEFSFRLKCIEKPLMKWTPLLNGKLEKAGHYFHLSCSVAKLKAFNALSIVWNGYSTFLSLALESHVNFTDRAVFLLPKFLFMPLVLFTYGKWCGFVTAINFKSFSEGNYNCIAVFNRIVEFYTFDWSQVCTQSSSGVCRQGTSAGITVLWPLLLTWINFNPSMDK